MFQDTKFLRKEILENLAPGREYCISVCFSDSETLRKSNFSQPVCEFAPGKSNSGTAQFSVSLADSKHPHMEFAGGCLFFFLFQDKVVNVFNRCGFSFRANTDY